MKVRLQARILFTIGLSTLAFAITAAGIGTRISDAGSEEANITRLTARLLESSQFSHHRLDDELAARFLDRYLDTLDGEHLLFLQSDLDNFDLFRPQLAQLTRQSGNTRPAHAIFSRYLERLNQQVSYVTNLLHSETFDFSGHDQCLLDREHAPRPRNLAEAQQLWRQHLRFEFLQEKLTQKKPEEIGTILSRRYTRFQQIMSRFSSDSVVELYLNALAHVYDPHSDYLGHEQMESLSMEMNLSLFGVGATMRVEDGHWEVGEVMPGGPAARSGLVNPGDRIVAVAQGDGEPVDVVDLPLSQTIELIRGPKGTTVRLTLMPSGAAGSKRKTVSLIRDEIKLEDQRAKARIVDLPRQSSATRRLGVIDLPSFYASMDGAKGGSHESATEDVTRLLSNLKAQHVQGVILDLRQNGGGSLEEAITLTGLFIRKGPVVQIRDRSGRVDVGAHSDGTVAYDGPLVVLTSRLSASASEILAGALKDYGRALIVGDSSTFGKGTVQEIIPLRPIFERNGLSHHIDPGALKVTIRKFYRPDGASTQLRGVKPDLVLPSLTDIRDIAESAMKDPLPWDAVSILQHDALNRVWPYVKFLRAKSKARLSNEADLVWLRDEVAQARRNLATKSVSLNEPERRQARMREQARADALRRERLADHETEPPTYEITVQNSASPSLPRMSNAMTTIEEKNAASDARLADDESSFATNIELRETENILADYIDLCAPATVLTQR